MPLSVSARERHRINEELEDSTAPVPGAPGGYQLQRKSRNSFSINSPAQNRQDVVFPKMLLQKALLRR